MSTAGESQDRANRVVVEVRVVFKDGSEPESVFYRWRDVQASGVPEIQIQDWMVEPRKSFPHPTDPIIYSMLVARGREDDARAWLAGLRPPPE